MAGKSLQWLAVRQLSKAYKAGDSDAARLLAERICLPLENELATSIKTLFLDTCQPQVISILWETWGKTRANALAVILIHLNQPAAAFSPAYVLSHIYLKTEMTIRKINGNFVDPLLELCRDREPEIAAAAFALAKTLKNQAAIDRVCARWAESRPAWLENMITEAGYLARKPAALKTLTALKFNHPEGLLHGGPEEVLPLLEACCDQDKDIASRANSCLRNLQNQPAIDELCRQWNEERNPILENAILSAHYLAEKPLSVWFLILLKTGRLDQARQSPPEGLDFLLAGLIDSDPTVAANALAVLGELKIPATIDLLCQKAIESEDRILIQTAVRAGYRPQLLDQCALFLFLTGQQAAYETLDFDRWIMQTVYEIAQPGLKNRIVRQVQISGKTDNLALLEGLNFRFNDGKINDSEIEMAVGLLAQNREWNRLWGMVFELPLFWSIKIIQMLGPGQWRPKQENEKELLNQLTWLASGDIVTDAKEFAQSLPQALQRATLKVRGRVNALAFANDQGLLAIGTGERKLGLWNFQKGAVERMLAGLTIPSARLYFAENSYYAGSARTRMPCVRFTPGKMTRPICWEATSGQ